MQKGINCRIADELLRKASSFDEIAKATGWNYSEIFDYLDSSFRNDNPGWLQNNIRYCCWGKTPEELAAENSESRRNELRTIREELCNDPQESSEFDKSDDENVKELTR